MFIQFGYVVLFSSAFPLAAMCALINNIIEIRSDALKLCTGLQRPFGQRVENIGQWQVRKQCSGKCHGGLSSLSGAPGHRRVHSSLSLALCLPPSDSNGGHGPDSHHCELLPDWSVWAAPATLPLVES